MAIKKSKSPYVRDVYLAYLIDGARRTETDEFPIIEEWMVATEPPKEIIQWDRRCDVKDPLNTAICFYCCDPGFQPILGNPQRYAEKMKQYQCVVGLDASPFDNMPLVVQKSQIYLNLGITYYYGLLGIKVIPNARLGDNRIIFAEQVKRIVDELEPKGICVYGLASDEIFGYARLKGIPIYQYDSYTMKENAKDRERKLSGVNKDER